MGTTLWELTCVLSIANAMVNAPSGWDAMIYTTGRLSSLLECTPSLEPEYSTSRRGIQAGTTSGWGELEYYHRGPANTSCTRGLQ